MSKEISRFNPINIESIADLSREVGVRAHSLVYYSTKGKDSAYQTFSIKKKSGGTRTILAPNENLKSIQRKLNVFLSNFYTPPSVAFGGIPTKNIRQNAKKHLRSSWVVRIDLENYYGTITSKRIFWMLKKIGFNNIVATVITNLSTKDGMLPQGAPTSPLLANMITFRLDKKMIRFAQKHHVNYTRYFDDLVFSAREENKDIRPKFMLRTVPEGVPRYHASEELRKIIEDDEGFVINSEKTRFKHSKIAQYVVGVKVNEKPNVSRSYIRWVRAMLHDWERNGYKIAEKNFKKKTGIDAPFKKVLRGYVAHIGFVRSPEEGDKDRLYLKLLRRFNRLPK